MWPSSLSLHRQVYLTECLCASPMVTIRSVTTGTAPPSAAAKTTGWAPYDLFMHAQHANNIIMTISRSKRVNGARDRQIKRRIVAATVRRFIAKEPGLPDRRARGGLATHSCCRKYTEQCQ